MDFEYKIESVGEGKRLSISGSLDTTSARKLETEIQPLVKEPGKELTVDLTGLTYISSSGLRCLVQLFNGTRAVGAKFNAIGVQPSVREIFDLTGFTKVFGL